MMTVLRFTDHVQVAPTRVVCCPQCVATSDLKFILTTTTLVECGRCGHQWPEPEVSAEKMRRRFALQAQGGTGLTEN